MKAILFKEDLKPYLIEMPEKPTDAPIYLHNVDRWNERVAKYHADIIEAKENAIPFDESCIDEVKKKIVYGDKTPLLDIGLSEFKPGGIYKIEGLDDLVEVEEFCEIIQKDGLKVITYTDYLYRLQNGEDLTMTNHHENKAFLKKQEESQEEMWVEAWSMFQYHNHQISINELINKFTIKRK